MGIANYFTFLRVFVSPIFFIIYVKAELLGVSPAWLPYILLGLFGVSELSDFMDGYLARKFDQVTDGGKILDPAADSIYRISIFLAFTTGPVQLPVIWVFAMVYRDTVIGTLRTLCALRGIALAARSSGKAKAFIQAMVIFIILILMAAHSSQLVELQLLQDTSRYLAGGAALYTLASGGEYLWHNWRHVQALFYCP